MEKLAKRIHEFINKYAAISPNYKEEEEDGDNKYTSPDAYELLYCAYELYHGRKPTKCFSEWGSGGYEPYTSKEGKEEHDLLVKEVYKIINT
jgi:hypothetical protein